MSKCKNCERKVPNKKYITPSGCYWCVIKVPKGLTLEQNNVIINIITKEK